MCLAWLDSSEEEAPIPRGVGFRLQTNQLREIVKSGSLELVRRLGNIERRSCHDRIVKKFLFATPSSDRLNTFKGTHFFHRNERERIGSGIAVPNCRRLQTGQLSISSSSSNCQASIFMNCACDLCIKTCGKVFEIKSAGGGHLLSTEGDQRVCART